MLSEPRTAPRVRAAASAVQHPVRLKGSGRVTVAAYGLADAEHLVEKEISRVWPEARVRITAVERAGEGERIAEEFLISYQISGTLTAEASSPEAASRAAFRQARERFASTRYWRTAWETAGNRERG